MPNILVQYNDLADAASDINKQGQHLEQQTVQVVQKVLNTFHNGGLEGKAAEILIGGYTQTFIPSLKRLAAKLHEVASDIQKNAEIMHQADSSGRGGFA